MYGERAERISFHVRRTGQLLGFRLFNAYVVCTNVLPFTGEALNGKSIIHWSPSPS